MSDPVFTYATVCSGVEGCSLALNAAPPTRGAWQWEVHQLRALGSARHPQVSF